MNTLTTDEVRRMREQDDSIPLINVLEPEQFQAQHVPGSINIPLDSDDFEQRVEQTAGGKDRPLIVYCASTQCDASPKAAKKLDAAGFSQVYDYEAGAAGWKEEGHKLQAGA